MFTVEEAEKIVQSFCWDYGEEYLPLMQSLGRVLAENLYADRAFPPFDRVSMDGIAIRFEDYSSGIRQFRVLAVQGAGAPPIEQLPTAMLPDGQSGCIEIMTGAILPPVADTIVPYEKIELRDGVAFLTNIDLKKGQHIHLKGSDKAAGDLIARQGIPIDAAVISLAATIGKSQLRVKKLPRVVIISSGDELVDLGDTPLPYQIRRSNSYALQGLLQQYGVQATLLHVPDELDAVVQTLNDCVVNYDAIVLSGGVSMGKFDFIPEALGRVGVQLLVNKVKQRPGKPFWFGTFGQKGVVFALPGNPVSTFLCAHRYLLPWLCGALGLSSTPQNYAVLAEPVRFEPPLTYFMQVKLEWQRDATLKAKPLEGRGSGDLANLLETDAFMELPANRANFEAGEILRIFPFSRPV